MSSTEETEQKQTQYVNLLRSIALFRGTVDAYLIPSYTRMAEQLKRELADLTPVDITENHTHQVYYFVKDTQRSLRLT